MMLWLDRPGSHGNVSKVFFTDQKSFTKRISFGQVLYLKWYPWASNTIQLMWDTHTHTHTHLTFILRQDTLFRSGDIADSSRTRAHILSQILEIAGSHWLLAPCPELAIRMQSTALCACWSWWLFIERALDHVVMHVCSVVIETGAGGWSAPVPARALHWLITWQSVTEYILTGS